MKPMFSGFAKLKYENRVFDILDVMKFSEVEIVTLDDDYFVVKAQDDLFFVRNIVGKSAEFSGVFEAFAEFSGRDSYGNSSALVIKKDKESKSWFVMVWCMAGLDLILEGEKILPSCLDLY